MNALEDEQRREPGNPDNPDWLAAVMPQGLLASGALSALLATAIIDAESLRLEWANRRFSELFGGDGERGLLGRPLSELLPAIQAEDDPFRQALARAMVTGEAVEQEEYRLDVPGGPRWWRLFVTPLRASEAPLRLLLHVVDITTQVAARQRIAAEAEAARDDQRILEALVQYIPEGMIVAEAPDVRIRRVSHDGCRLTGRQREEIEGTSLREPSDAWRMYHTEDGAPYSPEELPIARATLHGEQIFDEEMVIRLPDGSRRFILASAGPIRDEQGNVTGGIAVWRDITDRKRAEEQLRQSEENYRQLVQIAGAIILRMDREGRVTFFNEYAEQFFGFRQEEILGKPVVGLLVPHNESTGRNLEAYIEDLVRHPERHAYHENENLRKDGRRIWIAWSNRPILDPDGQVREILSVGLDITERRQMEEALRESEERFRLAVENYPSLFVIYDAQRRIQFINPAGVQAIGRPQEEILGHTDEELFVPEVTAEYLPLLHRAIESRTRQSAECAVRPPRRGARIVNVTFVPLLDERGTIRQVLGIAYDLTELKHAEAELKNLNETLERRVAERTAMAEKRAVQLRALAWEAARVEQRERRRLAQILHDHLQQSLVAARFKINLLERRLPDANLRTLVQDLEALINEAIDQSRSLTAELSPRVLYEAGLAAALEWLAAEMSKKHGLRVEVELDREAEPTAEDTRILLFQTVRELLFNIVKHAQTDYALVRMSPVDLDRVRIEVIDQGVGFDASQLAALESSPKGFGLFSIRERLELQGGHLEIDSAPGQGTHVTVEAPRHAPSRVARPVRPMAAIPPAQAAPVEHPPEAAGKIRVLLADDHAIVRQGLSSLLLEDPDIEVVGEAVDGEEVVSLALRLRPDVVLMDVTMPKSDGIEATRRITRQLPETRVIGLSMHEEEDLEKAMRSVGAIDYLIKTGPADILLQAIHKNAPAVVERRA